MAKARQKKRTNLKAKSARSQKTKTRDRATRVTSSTPDLSPLLFPEHLLENQLIKDLQNHVERLKIFDSLGKTLTSTLDLNEILQVVIDRLADLVNTSQIGLVFVNPQTNQFTFQYPPSTSKYQTHYSGSRGFLGRAIQSGKTELIFKAYLEPQFEPEVDGAVLENPESMIILPLISKGQVLGAFVFATAKGEPELTPENVRTLESLNDYLAIAIENSIHHQRVQDLTITDDLTRLYNSRYLPVVLERELARSRRYHEELTLVFLDLDNFKQVNDVHGHICGSQLLTEFGDFLYDHVRTSDIGIRYGGDEFVLILPKTSKAQAVYFVKRTIEELREQRFLKGAGLNVKITASFGVASFPEDGDTVDNMIAASDRAMYEVKRSSKDGVYALPSLKSSSFGSSKGD